MVAHAAFKYDNAAFKYDNTASKCDNTACKCDNAASECDNGASKCDIAAFKCTDKIAPAAAFAPSGGVSDRMRPNPGCRSLRSLALGWGLITPSGCSLNACVQNEIQIPFHKLS